MVFSWKAQFSFEDDNVITNKLHYQQDLRKNRKYANFQVAKEGVVDKKRGKLIFSIQF